MSTLFYPYGSSLSRLLVDRDPQGHVVGLVFHDDRHEERWEKRTGIALRQPSVSKAQSDPPGTRPQSVPY